MPENYYGQTLKKNFPQLLNFHVFEFLKMSKTNPVFAECFWFISDQEKLKCSQPGMEKFDVNQCLDLGHPLNMAFSTRLKIKDESGVEGWKITTTTGTYLFRCAKVIDSHPNCHKTFRAIVAKNLSVEKEAGHFFFTTTT